MLGMAERTEQHDDSLDGVPLTEAEETTSNGSVLRMLVGIVVMGLCVGLVLFLIGWAALAFWFN